MEICRAWSHTTVFPALGKVNRSIASSKGNLGYIANFAPLTPKEKDNDDIKGLNYELWYRKTNITKKINDKNKLEL